MKRSIAREKRLPAFKIDSSEFCLLVDKLIATFPDPKTVHQSIDVNVSEQETLSFKNTSEFQSCAILPESITRFYIYLSQDSQSIILRSSEYGTGSVHANGESEAWCAGAVEVTLSFLNQHKAWYHIMAAQPSIVRALILSIFTISALVAAISLFSALITPIQCLEKPMSVSASVGVIPLSIIFTIILANQNRFLPSARVVVRRKEGFIRRHSTEIMLMASLIGLMLELFNIFAKYISK